MRLKELTQNYLVEVATTVSGIVGGVLTAWVSGFLIPGGQVVWSWRIFLIVAGTLLFALLGKVIGEQWRKQKKTAAYFLTIITEQKDYPALIEAKAAAYFGKEGIAAAVVKPLITSGSFSTTAWRNDLAQIEHDLPMLIRQYTSLHFLCAAPWLWAFALGTRLGNLVSLQLYQLHLDGNPYLVWPGQPSVEERTKNAQFKLSPGVLTQQRSGADGTTVALVIAFSPEVSDQATQYLASTYPDVSVWCYYKNGALDPTKPEAWVQTAAEIAKAIKQLSENGKRTIYLLGSPPVALAFMVGSAVKRFPHLHLFHFFAQEKTYRKLLELPLDGS